MKLKKSLLLKDKIIQRKKFISSITTGERVIHLLADIPTYFIAMLVFLLWIQILTILHRLIFEGEINLLPPYWKEINPIFDFSQIFTWVLLVILFFLIITVGIGLFLGIRKNGLVYLKHLFTKKINKPIGLIESKTLKIAEWIFDKFGPTGLLDLIISIINTILKHFKTNSSTVVNEDEH